MALDQRTAFRLVLMHIYICVFADFLFLNTDFEQFSSCSSLYLSLPVLFSFEFENSQARRSHVGRIVGDRKLILFRIQAVFS